MTIKLTVKNVYKLIICLYFIAISFAFYDVVLSKIVYSSNFGFEFNEIHPPPAYEYILFNLFYTLETITLIFLFRGTKWSYLSLLIITLPVSAFLTIVILYDMFRLKHWDLLNLIILALSTLLMIIPFYDNNLIRSLKKSDFYKRKTLIYFGTGTFIYCLINLLAWNYLNVISSRSCIF